MKKFFYLFGVMLLSATVFTSCSDDDEGGNAKDLIGKWQSVSGEGWEKINGEIDDEWSESYDDVVFKFTEDRMYMYEYYDGDWELVDNIEYKYKDGKIISSGGSIDVEKLTSTTLVVKHHEIYTEDDDKYEYYERMTMRKADDIEL